MDLCFHYTNEIVYKDHNHARGPLGEFIYDLDVPSIHELFGKKYIIKYMIPESQYSKINNHNNKKIMN